MKKVSKRKLKKWQKWVFAIVLLFIIALILLLSKGERTGNKTYEEKDMTETILSEEQFAEEEEGAVEDVSKEEKEDKLYDSDERPNSAVENSKENSGTIIDKIKEFFASKENPDNDKVVENETSITDKTEDDSSENEKAPSGKNDGEERGELEIKEKIDASYEKYLAAGMVAAVSMQYPDFEIKEVYLTGEHSIDNKYNSEGAYVVFETGGKQMAVHSYALENERQEKGTIDLHTMDLGFSTFDVIEVDLINEAECVNMDINELDELITQSLLISLYEH